MEWWGWVTVTLSGLALLVNGAKNIEYIVSPFKNIQNKVKTVENKEKTHEAEARARFEKIEEIQRKQEETNQMMLKALLALINHEIDGNGVDRMKKVRNELTQNIIER